MAKELSVNSNMVRMWCSNLSLQVPTISAYGFQRSQPTRGGTVWQLSTTTDASKSRSTPILTVRCFLFSASGQFDAAELIRYMITKPQRRQPDQTHLKLLQMSGDVHPNPGPATKYSCPVCTRNVTRSGS